MFESHRKHTYWPPRPVTGIALLYIGHATRRLFYKTQRKKQTVKTAQDLQSKYSTENINMGKIAEAMSIIEVHRVYT
jgi:hypothetical protein